MEVQFAPDLQAKLDKLASETGRPPGELVEDVVAGYFDELAQARERLNSRYDALKSGRVKPIDGEAFFESLRQREMSCCRNGNRGARSRPKTSPRFGRLSRRIIRRYSSLSPFR